MSHRIFSRSTLIALYNLTRIFTAKASANQLRRGRIFETVRISMRNGPYFWLQRRKICAKADKECSTSDAILYASFDTVTLEVLSLPYKVPSQLSSYPFWGLVNLFQLWSDLVTILGLSSWDIRQRRETKKPRRRVLLFFHDRTFTRKYPPISLRRYSYVITTKLSLKNWKNVEKISRKELPKAEEIIVPIVAKSHVSRELRFKFCV